jgi:rubrerythrin
MSDERLIIQDGETDTAVIADYEATRRDAVRRGLIAGGAFVAATSIPLLIRVRNAFAQSTGDPAILESAIELEQTAVVSYDHAANAKLLKGDLKDTAKLFADQEQEHVDALVVAFESLGGAAPEPPEPDSVEGLTELNSQRDFLEFAIELENMAIVAYDEASAKLVSSELVKTGAEIVANEAQHLVVLRQALGANPLPDAFETGGRR